MPGPSRSRMSQLTRRVSVSCAARMATRRAGPPEARLPNTPRMPAGGGSSDGGVGSVVMTRPAAHEGDDHDGGEQDQAHDRAHEAARERARVVPQHDVVTA